MSTINLNLYNILKNDLKLSEAKAQAFAEAIKEEVINDIRLESQEYKSIVKDDFNALDKRIGENFNVLDKRIVENFNTLDKRLLESKNDMYKAMFVSGLVQLLAILGGVLAIVKFVQ